MKSSLFSGFFIWFGRSPSGERGLKFLPSHLVTYFQRSLPIRGAWIEMPTPDRKEPDHGSRSPSGERGLKCVHHAQGGRGHEVAPHPGSVD